MTAPSTPFARGSTRGLRSGKSPSVQNDLVRDTRHQLAGPAFGEGVSSRTAVGFWTQEHLTTATKMYREMGMTYWIEKAEAEMSELA